MGVDVSVDDVGRKQIVQLSVREKSDFINVRESEELRRRNVL